MPGRVLVLSASMGAGHDGAAHELAARLTERGWTVSVHDYLPLLPLRLGLFIRWFYGFQLRRAPESYGWMYDRCARPTLFLRGSLLFARLAGRRVLRLLRRHRPDVVVSTYPLATQLLGTLRAQGRLSTPTATYVTDFAAHNLCVSAHVDLHLTVSGPTAETAVAISGRPSVPAGPLVPARFTADACTRSRARDRVRTELGLGPAEIVALTVAGSWGVGDVRSTVARLAAGGVVRPVIVCGRNGALRAELAALPGVIALGWRADMPDLMAAADVLVENAGGLTAMEAFASGLPVISHECIAGHGRDNAGVMAAQGVVRWVIDPAGLVPAVVGLASPAGRAQAERARGVFRADAAEVVDVLARTGSVAAAVEVVTRARPTATRPRAVARPAPSSRRARGRRHATLAGITAGMSLLLSTTGVATAANLGMGVSSGQTDHPRDVYVVVRPARADLGVDGQVDERLIAGLRATSATVAVDGRLVGARQQAVRALGAADLTVVNAGAGHGGALDPRSARRDLVGARRVMTDVPGAEPWVFVACRSLTALDLTTSFVAEEVIVVPDAVVSEPQLEGPGGVALRGGSVVLLDGRGLPAGRMAQRLAELQASATAQHLRLSPLTTIVAHPD